MPTVEIDTSITGRRLIRVFERLKYERSLPETLRVDNGPEFLSADERGSKSVYSQGFFCLKNYVLLSVSERGAVWNDYPAENFP